MHMDGLCNQSSATPTLSPLGGSSPLLPCSHTFVAPWGDSSPIPKARCSLDSGACSVSHCQPRTE